VQTVNVLLGGIPEGRVAGFQEEVQLREQDWGNFQVEWLLVVRCSGFWSNGPGDPDSSLSTVC
jgi:hypothetical protein